MSLHGEENSFKTKGKWSPCVIQRNLWGSDSPAFAVYTEKPPSLLCSTF